MLRWRGGASLLLLFALVGLAFTQVPGRQYYSFDGRGNNLQNPELGAAKTVYKRETPYNYAADGWSIPEDMFPNARAVSNRIFEGIPEPRAQDKPMNDIHMAFGQFITHDMLRTDPPSGPEEAGGEFVTIPVPEGDPWFDPFGTGTVTLPLLRSAADPSTGTSSENPRQQLNFLTPWIDLGVVYGESLERANALRNATHPEYLATTRNRHGHEMGPFNTMGLKNANNPRVLPDEDLYVYGDTRGNENPVLNTLQTLFLRQHNRLVNRIREEHEDYDAETLYQEARRWNIALMQSIVFNEYFPVTMGGPMPAYEGYDANVDARVSNSWATLTLRYGHSEVNAVLQRANEERVLLPSILLRDGYFNNVFLERDGIEDLLRGAGLQTQQDLDVVYVDDIRNFLFGTPGRGGHDLAVMTLMRARDHGMPLYNDFRQAMGLPRVQSFRDVTNKTSVAEALEELYGHPDLAEAFPCSLAETDFDGTIEGLPYNSGFGETFAHHFYWTFVRLRDGDRLFFQNTADDGPGFTRQEREEIQRFTVADLIIDNSDIHQMPCSAFFASTVLDCGEEEEVEGPEVELGENVLEFFNGRYVLSWTVDQEEEAVDFVLQVETEGWVGLGFANSAGSMIDMDAIIGSVSGGRATIGDYYVDGVREAGCPGGVCPDSEQGGRNDVEDADGREEGGRTVLQFRRALRTDDAGDQDVEIVDALLPINVAYGPSDSIGYHGSNKASAEVNFFTGEGTVTSSSGIDDAWDRLTVHGVLMFLGWAVMFPLGIFVVRFCKRLLLRWWFRIHLLMQYTGVLVVLIALILAVEAVAYLGHDHFDNAHGILGIIVMCFSPPLRTSLQSLVASQPPSRRTMWLRWTHSMMSSSSGSDRGHCSALWG